MRELALTIIVGFISGVVGASVVVWLDEPEPIMQSATVALPRDVGNVDANPFSSERAPEPEAQAIARAETIEAQTENSPGQAAATEASSTASSLTRRQQWEQRRAQREQETRERLLAAGWSEFEIDQLEDLRVESALEMEKLMFEQMREQFETNPITKSFYGRNSHLREQLGDERYEDYLVAQGQPTSVPIRAVLEGSAGQSAGLQEGDQIRRYGDTRVFDESDLMMAMLAGEPGDSVTVEVERNGTTFHITVPRGPLGTTNMGMRFR